MSGHTTTPDMRGNAVVSRKTQVDDRVLGQPTGEGQLPPQGGGLVAHDGVAVQDQQAPRYSKRVRFRRR
ncbi:hypothetical protein [Tersicoccus phoenicis]|uniref:hypothetical protein n=1 Tax=Tersicoccus phoenicis TaxID=554083 RepID=UPI000A06CA5C|nr:hypothetical protein [Tersicoccus phoenicis]